MRGGPDMREGDDGTDRDSGTRGPGRAESPDTQVTSHALLPVPQGWPVVPPGLLPGARPLRSPMQGGGAAGAPAAPVRRSAHSGMTAPTGRGVSAVSAGRIG